ncbi:hypothetical protein M7I_1226 [Glarea lozoyensis 74030]|nr:hypothetical protein M7I_1226 [Glarea lozoyensis 74030]
MIRGTPSQISRNTRLSYKHGSYNSVFELKEVSDKLECTLASVMSVVETMKINRLIPPKESTNSGLDILPPNFDSADSKISDTCDYATFPNFETTLGASFEELSRYRPGLSDTRARVNVNNQHLAKLLFQSSSAGKAEADAYIQEFLTSPPSRMKLDDTQNYLTDIEDLARICHEEMTLIVTSNLDSTRWNDANFSSILKASNLNLTARLEEAVEQVKNLNAIVPAFGSVLHIFYTTYDLSLITHAFCNFLNSKEKTLHTSQSPHTPQILAQTKELKQAISEQAAAVKKGLDEGGWIDKVLDSVNGTQGNETLFSELGDLVDAGQLEVWAGDLVEGWKDSCEGLMLKKVVV